MNLQALVVESDTTTHYEVLTHLSDAGIGVAIVGNISAAKDCVRSTVAERHPLDVLIVADAVEDGQGLSLVEWFRNLSDEYVTAGGLRCRHLPIVLLSTGLTDAQNGWLTNMDSAIPVVAKPIESRALLLAVDQVIGRYRHEVMIELDRAGLAVTYDDNRFRVMDGYVTRPGALLDCKLLEGTVGEAGQLCRRLILSHERAQIGSAAIDELEDLLNDKKSSETTLHAFFERHPEFLADGTYSWYWSELTLRNSATKAHIRPDFILRPLVARVPWDWHVLDLKSPHVKVTAYQDFHRDWSSHVHHVVRQLRNYRNFFRDQRNRELLASRFGGVIPRPRLTAIIGKDYGEIESVTDLVDDLADVRIRTYDEVLTFRREHVQRLRSALRSDS
jgi:hypothetical protein